MRCEVSERERERVVAHWRFFLDLSWGGVLREKGGEGAKKKKSGVRWGGAKSLTKFSDFLAVRFYFFGWNVCLRLFLFFEKSFNEFLRRGRKGV